MDDDGEARSARKKMVLCRSGGNFHRGSIILMNTGIDIQVDMLHRRFWKDTMQPMCAALKSDVLHGNEGFAQMETLSKIGKEFEMKCSSLKIRKRNAKEDANSVGLLLDEGIIDIAALKLLSDEEQQELVRKWKDVDEFMKNLVRVFLGLELEWNVMERKFKKEVQDCMSLVTILAGNKAFE